MVSNFVDFFLFCFISTKNKIPFPLFPGLSFFVFDHSVVIDQFQNRHYLEVRLKRKSLMIKKLLKSLSSPETVISRKHKKDLAAINALSSRYAEMDDDGLREARAALQSKVDDGEDLEGNVKHEAFAIAREACWRVLGKRPYDVQVLGGLILHDGKVAEMRTGEGKTITAAMPTFLNALAGKGVHVVTVNDYLAARDAAQIGRVHEFLGLSVGVVLEGMDDFARRKAYACDVTYATNNELGFDYLRDNLRFDISQMVQRGHNFAIVDEVDSILIDEARTPLIISAPTEDSSEMCMKIDRIAASLKEGLDYRVDEKLRAVMMSEIGLEKSEAMMKADGVIPLDAGLYDGEAVEAVYHLNAAVRAHGLFKRDRDYVVKDGKVVIVDENTGRMMDGRRFGDGIHQALEAKEHVEVMRESQSLSSITYQNFFRLYTKLSGMTGTAATEQQEFAEVYGLNVTAVPTHRPVIRIDEPDEIHLTTKAKFDAITTEVIEARRRMQPVLIGTASVEKSDLMARRLEQAGFREGTVDDLKAGIPIYRVLNARNHGLEAEIISQAGMPGAVTIATNMAGRGTDIELGGSVEKRIETEIPSDVDEAERATRTDRIKFEVDHGRQHVLTVGGLLVIGTERHESRRVDNQLRGRSGRQGDPGRSKFFVSLEDDVTRIFGSDRIGATARRLGVRDGDAISHPLVSKLLEGAQKKVEERNYAVRKEVVKFDDVNDAQRKAIHQYRLEIMGSKSVREIVSAMREQAVERAIERSVPANSYPDSWNVEALSQDIVRLCNISLPIAEWAKEDGVDEDDIYARIVADMDNYERLREEQFDEGVYDHALKHVLLENFDRHWREHLQALEEMKSMIGFRGYAQVEPIAEYRTEAFQMFERMLDKLADDVTAMTSKIVSTKPTIEAAA